MSGNAWQCHANAVGSKTDSNLIRDVDGAYFWAGWRSERCNCWVWVAIPTDVGGVSDDAPSLERESHMSTTLT